jgi:ferredoxin
MSNTILDHLSALSESDWLRTIEQLLPEMHEVDRNAVAIWFRFYPLSLQRFVAGALDREAVLRGMAMQGDFELINQIDTSHHFLYGHRYWRAVKEIISNRASATSDALSIDDVIRKFSENAAEQLGVNKSLTIAIAAVGLATLQQVGIEAFVSSSGSVREPEGLMKRSPDEIVAERKKDDSQGLLGFLKTVDKKFTVHFTGTKTSGKFPVINEEEIAAASQKDHSRDWKSVDPRCWEGPVPIECTSASCGTCWIGVLAGQEKLSEVQRRERRAMKVFGYNQPDEAKPFLRLACQAEAHGNVHIVIPPWNAVFGKKVYGNVEDLELEPVTTSAKRLRETIASAVSGE